jgi:oxalate decarboxylase
MSRASAFKYDLKGSAPQIVAKGGTIQEGNQSTFPGLAGNGLSIYFLTLQPGAVRIPHWHPDAAELDYVLAGKARVGLGFPDGEWQRFDLGAGEIAMLQMLVVFNNSAPNDIGVSVGFQTVPKEVLALTFGVPAETFDKLDLNVEYIAPQ